MYLVRKRFSDNIYRTGIICLGFSLLLYLLPVITNAGTGSGIFLFNSGLTAIFFIYRFIARKQVSKEAKLYHGVLLLVLFFVSAWALNREITVFERSAGWFSVLLALVCANSMAFAYFPALPGWVRHFVSFLNGIAVVTFFYLSLCLMPIYIFGLAASPLLGVSLHVFAPVLLFIYTLLQQKRITRRNKQYRVSFGGGIIATLAIVITFTIQWNTAARQIDRAWTDGIANKAGLPAWVATLESIPSGSLVRTVLKGDLVYTSPEDNADNFFWNVPVRGMGEPRKHDPLIMIASCFSPGMKIDRDSRIKLLEAGFDKHHETEEHLWSGDNLHTDSVNTEVKIWPRCNLAYTEKTIIVVNTRNRNGWDRQGEAIYTFYMPEGSVVTSLSLWIQGKEEKGILTTKEKADSAYRAIVGVEQRDPSVVHWQEGNTVLVRVFPVIAGEQRKFKIGITSPLERVNGSLRYENVYFKGPAFNHATETIQVDFEQPVSDFDLPASFVSKASQSYNRRGRYSPVWELQINDPGLSGCSYSFKGNEYSLSPYHEKLSPLNLTALYLDINQSWTRQEFDALCTQVRDYGLFVYDNGIIKVQEANREVLWEKLHARSFSFFPLYEISDAQHSLLVTKYAPSALRLVDLEETDFMRRTRQFLSAHAKINVFNLGEDLSLYLRSLKEYRVFRYDNGDAALLAQRLQKGLFPEDIENESRTVIHRTDIIVEKRAGAQGISGPDHVMRLFSYNHILQQLGPGLLLDRSVDDSLVQEARAAYVVTPVSSLVVLETQNDYDRFGIKDAGSSLKNAALHAKGAVPEPHEWVLIGMVMAILAWVIRKRKIQYRV